MTTSNTRQFGPYLLQGLIGAGAMGEVHRAVDTAHDGRLVALKLLPPEIARDPQRRARFERESHVVAALTEPHVIDVHRYGAVEGRLFLDMQLVDGPDLAAHLMATGPLPPEHAVAIVEQVAAALDASHAAGLVHHDVKPSNVLLYRLSADRTPRVVLADFGISGDPDGFGTAEYLAPERWNGMAGDARVDVYALTCMLYELLTGTRAYPGGDFAAQLHGHLHLPPPRPSAFPGLPGAFDAVIATGMAKDPAQRVPTAGELAATARAALTPPRRGPSRRQLLIGVAAGLLVAGGGVAVASAVRSGSRSGGGSAPERLTADRALGIRSSVAAPFTLGAVGDTAIAVVVDGTGDSARVQAWDVLADRAVGPPQPGGTAGIASGASQLAVADVGGRGLLCSTTGTVFSPSNGVAVADLTTAEGLDGIATPSPVRLAATEVDGTPVLFVLDGEGALSRIDVDSRSPIGPRVPVLGAGVLANLSIVDVGGTSCVLVVPLTRPSKAFDVSSSEPVAEWTWNAQAVVTVDDEAIGFAAGAGDTVLVSAAGEQPRRLDVPGTVTVAAADVDGHGVAAVGLRSGDIALYDAATGTRMNAVLTGHRSKITQLGVVRVRQRPLLVSAAADNTIRVWDLAVHARG